MFTHNSLLNTPLAIDPNYLRSILPDLAFHFIQQNKMNAQSMEQEKYLSHIHAQFENTHEQHKTPIVLNIIGPIVKYNTYFAHGTSFYADILKKLDKHPRVSGIVLNIDSGGGMVSGTAELTSVIKSMNKPTISYTNGYQCSAALDIASGCNYHMASPHADLIGSIGTMLSYQDFSAMFEKWGAKIYNIYAPQSEEKNKEFRELIKGNEALYTERLQVLAGDFISRMKENYGEKIKDDGKVFKGKTYTPQEALQIGLIDELGTLENALSKF